MGFTRFIDDKKGAITMEFAAVIVAMVAIIYFAMDTGIYILERNKLERANYSLITLIRERTKLYNNDNLITQKETDELAEIGIKLTGGSLGKNLKIRLEGIYFDEDSERDKPIIEKTVAFVSQSGSTLSDAECFSELTPTADLQKYSVWVDPKGWTPIFRVTICAQNVSSTPIFYYSKQNSYPSIFVTSSIGMLR